jgi:ParB/RepB/Spo0J family partition protein
MLKKTVNKVFFMTEKNIDVSINKLLRVKTPFRIATVKEHNSLLKSIKAEGLKVPLLVRDNKDGTYTILDGVRRFNVCKELGYETLPCIMEEN